ncbi:MAG: RNA polymerase sigma factor [Planctomycetota bacterium]
MAEPRAEPSDEALAERVARRDRDAFRTLYERHKNMVYNVVYRIVGNRDAAEDLVQDTFLAAYAQAGSFQRRARFSTWLTSIAINKSINASKQGKLRFSILKRVFGKPAPDEPPHPPAADDDRVQKLLRTFPPRLRALVTLRYMQNFSYEQIAETLGCAVGTVKSRLFQAHEMMRQALTGKGAGS